MEEELIEKELHLDVHLLLHSHWTYYYYLLIRILFNNLYDMLQIEVTHIRYQ